MGPSLPTVIVVGYVAVLLAIGYWASRLAKRGKDGFFLAGRRLSVPLVAVLIGIVTLAFALQVKGIL